MGDEIIKFKGEEYEVGTVEELKLMLKDILKQELNLNIKEHINNLLQDTIDFYNNEISNNDIECINFMNEKVEQLEAISVRDCKDYMESLVFKRFDNKERLEEELSKHFGCEIKLEEQTYCSGSWEEQEEYDCEMLGLDYGLIGNINNGEIFCDIDIYYANTRVNKGKGIIITEVSYEFETSKGLVDESCF